MIIKKDGNAVAIVPVTRSLDQWYAENGLDPAAHTVEYNDAERRQLIRAGIYGSVADLDGLVGIMADSAAICMHMLGTLSKALETATDVSDIRTALAPFEPAMAAYRDKLDAGTIKLPYLAKGGLNVVMPEIEAAGTAVAAVFEAQA